MKYLVFSLMCFAFKGEEKTNKYDRLLNAICNDIYDNNINITIKKSVGDNAFLVTDPITETSRVEFEEPLTEQSKKLKKDFTPEKQLEIMEAYEWPIFPLGDTIFLFDRTKLFTENVLIIEKPQRLKKTFVISHLKPGSRLNSIILDTIINKQYHTFVSIKSNSDTNSTFFFRISKKDFNDLNSKIILHKGAVNKSE